MCINTLHVYHLFEKEYHLFEKDFVGENRSSEEIRTVEKRRNTQSNFVTAEQSRNLQQTKVEEHSLIAEKDHEIFQQSKVVTRSSTSLSCDNFEGVSKMKVSYPPPQI